MSPFKEVRLDRLFDEVNNLRPAKELTLLTPSVVQGVVPQSSLGSRPQQALREGYCVIHAQPDDFVISMSSHAHGIEHCGLEGGISPDYTVLRPKFDRSMIGFISYALKSKPVIHQLGAFKTGIRMGLRLTWNKVKFCKLNIPDSEYALKIAAYLDSEVGRIESLIKKKRAFIDLLKEKRHAVIMRAVTRGLDPDVSYVETGVQWLGGIPEHWALARFSHALFECRERNIGLKSENYLSLTASRGVITYDEKGNVGNKKPNDLEKCKVVYPGDYVLNSMNYQIGSYGVSRYHGVCSPVYVVMRHRKGVADPHFLDLILASPSFQNYAQSFGTGILDHRRAIGWDELKVISIPLPPLAEQREIVRWAREHRRRIDALIEKTSKSVDLLHEHRAALIAAAVTGKIDVRNAA